VEVCDTLERREASFHAALDALTADNEMLLRRAEGMREAAEIAKLVKTTADKTHASTAEDRFAAYASAGEVIERRILARAAETEKWEKVDA